MPLYWFTLFLKVRLRGRRSKNPRFCPTWNTPNRRAMFQEPPRKFHLEHAREGGAPIAMAGGEVDLHRVRLMSLLNELIREHGQRLAHAGTGGPASRAQEVAVAQRFAEDDYLWIVEEVAGAAPVGLRQVSVMPSTRGQGFLLDDCLLGS